MPTAAPRILDPLRLDAEARLREGTSPPATRALSAETLARLFRLASTPDTANDGLKLLHELQVHQVELDLQQEQIEADERDTADALAHYKAVFDFAPVVYLVVNNDGHVVESNLAGAQLFGVSREKFAGLPIAGLFCHDSRQSISQMLVDMRQGVVDAGCTAYAAGADSRQLHVTARFAPGRHQVLMIVLPCSPSPAA